MKNRLSYITGSLQVFVAVGALPAGFLMLLNPDGSDLGMTIELLNESPFESFFIPGLFLFTINGLMNAGGAMLSFIKNKHAGTVATFLGLALVLWIIAQVSFVGLSHFLQPVYFFIGITEIILGMLIIRNLNLQEKHN